MKTILTLLGCLCTLVGANVLAAERPNLLLIIADDLNWRDLGVTGSPDVQTPHLDQLATQGMQLTSMFTPAPTCSPCRHALYTGLFSMRSGAYPNHTRAYDGTHSMFTYLKDAGYRVALQGKTHIGPPQTFPYEHLGKGPDDFAATREYVARKADQPWLLVYASHDPHSPWTRGPRDKYDPAKITIPPYLHDNEVTRKQLAAYYAEITQFDSQVGELMQILDETQQAQDTLVLFVSEQGSSFPYGGKWSLYDNGIHVASLVRWPGVVKAGSKSSALVQYVDVAPTFLAAAGLDPKKVDTGCPDANGARGFDGKSFLSVLKGETDQHREVIFAQHTTVGINGYQEPYPIRAARDARYKLIRNLAPQNRYSIGGIHQGEPITSWQQDAKDDPKLAARIEWLFKRPAEELYDLESDPEETHNLAGDPQLAAVQARLGKALEAWMQQQGDRGMETELNAKSRQGANRSASEKKKKKAK